MIQTTTKEVSKQLEQALKEAGYNHKSELLLMMEDLFDLSPQHRNDFSMSELWSMLKPELEYLDMKFVRTLCGNSVYYWHEEGILEDVYFEGPNMCDSIALLVMWCISNKLPLAIKKKEESYG